MRPSCTVDRAFGGAPMAIERPGTKPAGHAAPEKDWAIEQLFAGDVSNGVSGQRFLLGHYYASSSLHGGPETFYEIDIKSLRLRMRGGTRVNFNVQPGTSQSRKQKQPPTKPTATVIRKGAWSRRERLLRDVVRRFCSAHPGWSVVIGGPGARTVSHETGKFTEKSAGRIFMSASEGECVVAAIVNAIDVVRGRAAATEAKEYLAEQNPHYLRVATCAAHLQKMRMRCDVRKVPRASKEMFKKDPFGWLGGAAHGVWIVRLKQRNVVDHCVVVDGVRGLILDSAEEYPLRLSAEALRLCGGSAATNLEVAEAREIREVVGHVEAAGLKTAS